MDLPVEGFLTMTPSQFGNAWQGYNAKEEAISRERWEIMRMQTMVLANVSGNLKKPLKLQDIIQFPWEQASKRISVQQFLKDNEENLNKKFPKTIPKQ